MKALTAESSDVAARATALKERLAKRESMPALASKIVASSAVDCKAYEFNVWHANSDNVKTNGGDLPWGTL